MGCQLKAHMVVYILVKFLAQYYVYFGSYELFYIYIGIVMFLFCFYNKHHHDDFWCNLKFVKYLCVDLANLYFYV